MVELSKKPALKRKLQWLAGIGAAVLTTLWVVGSVDFVNNRSDHQARKENVQNQINEMWNIHGWQSTLEEDSPLWRQTTGTQKDIKMLTADQLNDYASCLSFVSRAISMFPLTGNYTPQKDPQFFYSHIKDELRLTPRDQFDALSSPDGLGIYQLKLKEREMFDLVMAEVMSKETGSERFQGLRAAKQELNTWMKVVNQAYVRAYTGPARASEHLYE